ncbi:purine nucleoside permease [Granulicella sp. dw_53]|uniref:purine nucleoside permease n=1 Tax=Granulicella sp. dw_53 TaxID=2719792 RepID=UPI001BD30457|nr:purine nucleoside permease [Granulicella sp. dw_53]
MSLSRTTTRRPHTLPSLARPISTVLLLAVSTCVSIHAQAQALPKPIEIKVVVINMFEQGADTGDIPGEYQFWVERQHLDTVLTNPAGYHDLRLNPSTGVLGLLTGVGTSRATASVMALGLDPRFDLTHAYFLVAGIAGIDPAMGSLGSAVWSDWIIDGDQAHEIDAREIPNATEADRKLWTTGYIPLGKSTPYEQPRHPRFGDDGNIFHLNTDLVSWAFNLTKDVQLPDSKQIADRRQSYNYPAAKRPPFVLRGDNLSASTYWHGKLLNQWARDWVKYETDGKGTYAVCGMEDTGTLQSLTWLAKAGKVDLNRVLVLRTASNYDQQREGISAAESLAETKVTKYSAYISSLDSAYRVGHVVVDSLVTNWPQTRDHIPTTTTPVASSQTAAPSQ